MDRIIAGLVSIALALPVQAQPTTAGALMKDGYSFITVSGLTVFLLQKGDKTFVCRWETLGVREIAEVARKVGSFPCAPIPE